MNRPRKSWIYWFFLLQLSSPAFAVWWNQTTFYEIFVRSYQDSDGDGIGDLNGITSRLDYLKELGVKGIWLTPIFLSPSYHGYDATDYKAIDPDYGTLSDLQKLLREAHRRDIKVLLDIAVNHTSDQHPWFKEKKQRDMYVWRKTKPTWGKWYLKGSEYYYSVFDRSMPNLNWLNPEVPLAVKDLLRFWLKQGVDGFRLDAARYYVAGPNGEPDTPETHAAIADFAESMRAEFPQVLFVGEIWTDSKTIYSYCASGKELDLAFNFPLAFSLVPSLNSEDPSEMLRGLREYQTIFQRQHTQAPFLSNHDMTRIATVLYEYAPKVKLAAEIYFMLPGSPFLYYGEEIGMPNGKGQGDEPKRLPMQWDDGEGYGFSEEEPWADYFGKGEVYSVAVQEKVPKSFLQIYRRLIHFRNANPVIATGSMDGIQSPAKNVVVWRRKLANQTALVAVNLSYQPSPAFTVDGVSKLKKLLYGDGILRGKAGAQVPSLTPHSVQVYEVE